MVRVLAGREPQLGLAGLTDLELTGLGIVGGPADGGRAYTNLTNAANPREILTAANCDVANFGRPTRSVAVGIWVKGGRGRCRHGLALGRGGGGFTDQKLRAGPAHLGGCQGRPDDPRQFSRNRAGKAKRGTCTPSQCQTRRNRVKTSGLVCWGVIIQGGCRRGRCAPLGNWVAVPALTLKLLVLAGLCSPGTGAFL